MPLDALPERLQNPANWKGTDDDIWYMRWRLYCKGWFAYGPRSNHKWAKWRTWPITLLAFFGKGPTRFESETWERGSEREHVQHTGTIRRYIPPKRIGTPWYLSRVQYYTRWHIQFQWPFMIAFHFYFKVKDVPIYDPNGEHPKVSGKWLFGYLGAHRDSDRVYWFPSAYLGTSSK